MVAGKDAKGKPAGKSTGKGGKDEKSTDESVIFCCSKFYFHFYNICIPSKFEPIKVDARLANTAVLMLDSPEEDVLQKACESIFKFCEKSIVVFLFKVK